MPDREGNKLADEETLPDTPLHATRHTSVDDHGDEDDVAGSANPEDEIREGASDDGEQSE